MTKRAGIGSCHEDNDLVGRPLALGAIVTPAAGAPTVTLAPPKSAHEVSCFMNIRVADIRSCYERWRARGAQFITGPKDLGGVLRQNLINSSVAVRATKFRRAIKHALDIN